MNKKEPYIFSARPDAFGCRLISVICALWISKKLNYNFYFHWISGNDSIKSNMDKGIDIASAFYTESVENIFHESFIKKHHVIDNCCYGRNFKENLTLQELKKYKQILYSEVIIPYEIFKGLDKNEVLKEIKNIYVNDIIWSKKYYEIIKDVEYISYKLGDFIAIHMRGGEHIYTKYNQVPFLWANLHHFPYEVALEIAISMGNKNKKIVLFGQDLKANEKLIECVNEINPTIIINTIDSLLQKKYSKEDRVFFDLNCIAKASQIYSSGYSNFSRLAALISGKETLVTYFQSYNTDELYNIILKNIDYVNLNNLYKAYSYYRLYDFSTQLNKDISESISFLKKALEHNPNNYGYIIALNDCYFKINEPNEVENNLKNIILANKFEEFEEVFYGIYSKTLWSYEYYSKIHNKYLDCASLHNFPYISYVASKIYQKVYKNNAKAVEIMSRVIVYETNNIRFINLFIELLNLSNLIQANSAKARIHSHLAYKLGSALIENSKSIKGYIRLPYVLSYIKDKHKKEQKIYKEKIKENINLKLPPLDTYPDYKDALKEKECITYKLGLALMKADKEWYKGGYIKFYFEAKKLKKEFKEKQKG